MSSTLRGLVTGVPNCWPLPHPTPPLLPGLAALKETFHCGTGALAQAQGARPGPTGPVPSQPGTRRGASPGCLEPGSAAGPRSRRQFPGWQRATRKGRRVQDGSGNWLWAQPLLHGGAAPLTPRGCSGRWSGRAPGSGTSLSEIRRTGLAAKCTGVFCRRTEHCPGGRAPQNPQGQLREDEGRRGAQGRLAPPLRHPPRRGAPAPLACGSAFYLR